MMVTEAEAEAILASRRARDIEAKQTAEAEGISYIEALAAQPGSTVPEYMLPGWEPDRSGTLIAANVEMTEEGIQAINPELPVKYTTPIVQTMGGGEAVTPEVSMTPISPTTTISPSGSNDAESLGQIDTASLIKWFKENATQITNAYQTGGFTAVLALVPPAMSGLASILGWEGLATAAGIAAVGYGIYDAFTEGGLIDIGGGGGAPSTAQTTTQPTGGVTMGNGQGLQVINGGDFILKGVLFQGPGVKEPLPALVARMYYQKFEGPYQDTWIQYWTLINGVRACRNYRTGRYSVWRPAKMAVISKNMPTHRTLTRLRGYLSRQVKDAKTIVKLGGRGGTVKIVQSRRRRR